VTTEGWQFELDVLKVCWQVIIFKPYCSDSGLLLHKE